MPVVPPWADLAVRDDRGAQGSGRVVQAGLDGADRDADDVGDLGQGRPAWWCRTKTARCSGDRRTNARSRASRSSTATVVSGPRSVDRQRPEAAAPATMPTQLLVAGIDEQPVEPGTEALRIAEPREFAPGEEECLLDGVLGPLRVAQDPVRDRVASVAFQVDELGEGDVVAVPRLFDQPRPHRRCSVAPRWDASPHADGRIVQKVHPLRRSRSEPARSSRASVRADTARPSRRPRTSGRSPRPARRRTLRACRRPRIRAHTAWSRPSWSGSSWPRASWSGRRRQPPPTPMATGSRTAMSSCTRGPTRPAATPIATASPTAMRIRTTTDSGTSPNTRQARTRRSRTPTATASRTTPRTPTATASPTARSSWRARTHTCPTPIAMASRTAARTATPTA